MGNRRGYVCVFVFTLCFVLISTFLWTKFFSKNMHLDDYLIYGLDFKDEKKLNDIISIKDDEEIVELDGYHFSVSSVSNVKFDYTLVLDDIDVCKADKMFERDELSYALYLEENLIKKGTLGDIIGNNLYTNNISDGDVHNYSFKVWISDDEPNSELKDKYYCYNILLEV